MTDPIAQHAVNLAEDAPEEEAKVLTNSRWQAGNKTPRFDKRQQQDVDAVLDGTRGFFRGARITSKGNQHG